MIADVEFNKKLKLIITELYIRGRKINISRSFFIAPKNIKLNEIPNEIKLQQISVSQSPDINFKDFMKIWKYYFKEMCSLLMNNTTLLSDNWLRFRKNLP